VRHLAALGVLAVVVVGTSVQATTVAELCGDPVPDPCRITTPRTVESGSVLDLRPGALVVATSNGRLDAGGGTMAILARDVTLEPGGRLVAAGGGITVIATGRIVVDASARIDTSATGGGGRILLGADGDVLVDGPLRAAGIGIPAFGGSVVVGAGGSVRLAEVDASGGTQASPTGAARAAVDVVAGGSVTLGGTIDASHGECLTCTVEVTAGGDLVTRKVDVRATGPGGDGGSILLAARSIVLNGDLVAAGSGGDPDFGGGGGDVLVEADDDLTVNGSILLGGTPPDGDGGTFELEAGGDLQMAGSSVFDADGGGEGCGGFPASMTAGRDLVAGRIKLAGGSCGGGSIDLLAGRDLTVASRITAGATDDGAGGDIAIDAAGSVLVGANLDTGAPVAGTGGSVLVEGCDVTLPGGIVIGSTGPGGSNALLSHGVMTIAGRVEAGATNLLAYGDPTLPPLVTGTILPPVPPQLDPTLLACAAFTPCGNGAVQPPEECDDGNAEACDGCSATCQAEVCGNGRLDCREACDPPDGVRCDAACQVVPQPVVKLLGAPGRNGCQAEWELELAAAEIGGNGLPKATQRCTDGDPGCDADGDNDGRCTFRGRVCLRVDDPRRPDCAPAAIDHVKMKWPLPLDPGDATDAANASVLLDALGALGVTVLQGTTVLHGGVPDASTEHCTAPIALLVPHAGRKARRRFNLGAADVAGKTMSNNSVRLDCIPSTAVCGDGVIGIGEECEDGNTQGCDGCSPRCRHEACGNGTIDCDEQCDAGVPDPPPATGCTARCTEAAPPLRIPGGGGRPRDCALEWAVALDDGRVSRDGHGVPRNRQDCVDGDPACDFDATAGSCRVHVFACLGGADDRLGCAAARVTAATILSPKEAAQSPLRDALDGALQELGLPVGPGEACTRRIDVDVPAGKKRVLLKLGAQIEGGKLDRDSLKLRCLPAPAP
jgi:cysteine-rich repeat protein